MSKIQILGMGPGTRAFITPYVFTCIQNADVLIGGKRHFKEIQEEAKDKERFYITSDLMSIVHYINVHPKKKIAILVSGDPGFYSLLVFLKKHFQTSELEVVPGLSSMQYMFCKLSLPWQDAIIKSLHGKEFDFIEAFSKSSLVGMLTDTKNTPVDIAKELVKHGLGDVWMHVGEELSYKEEKITSLKAIEMQNCTDTFKMNVVIIEKEHDVTHQR